MKPATADGVVLIIVLIWLMVVTLLALSAVQIGVQEQKAARNYRDRAIAFQSAEAGLLDAESDIEDAPDRSASRSALFGRHSNAGFPPEDGAACQRGDANPYQGLCRQDAATGLPLWLQVDLAAGDNSATVPYGRFTGRRMPTASGALPARLPRYLIELLRYRQAGDSAEQAEYFYRITAIGFGTDSANQVVLQSFYRKGNAP